jgi:hypothetical protein
VEDLIGALLGWIVRAVFGSRPAQHGRLDAPPTPPTTRPRVPASPAAPPIAVRVAPRIPAAARPPAASTAALSPSPETRLVTGLFATPQSLAAAFVASEILQPPVGLRR